MPKRAVNVLSVSGFAQDHATVAEAMRPEKWTFYRASTLTRAQTLLAVVGFNLVICERDLPWKDLLAEVLTLPRPPFFIVTSRLADDCLWAEALNLGAYDVLAKPFQREEVRRSLSFAAIRWTLQSSSRKPFVVKGAGG